ncbi:hypothetical protein PTKIN_Ptkin02bG0059400 [Pterospermum kingtungense]
MKLKNKGKVYPSPSSSSGEDYLSILKLLPAAILALASVLSLEDREVLAYMITRSLKTTTTTTTTADSSLISQDYSSKKRSSKKPPPNAAKTTQKSHKPPVFDCDCFNCYTSYWFRWDTSPNRELINQVIEAFEDHLTNGEAQKPSKKNSRPKRRDNSNSKAATKVPDVPVVDLPCQPVVHEVQVSETTSTEEAPVLADEVTSNERDVDEKVGEVTEVPAADDADVEETTTESPAATTSTHKGLARKVLPDVLGLFNSRLWGLWNPNV